MKIAQVCPYNIFRPGGVQNHIACLKEKLIQFGHEVKIIAPSPNKKPVYEKDYFLIGKFSSIKINKTESEISSLSENDKIEIKKFIKKEKFDIMHFHEPWSPSLATEVLFESKAKNVATFHAAFPGTLLSRSFKIIFKPLAKYVLKRIDKIIAVSNVPAEYLRELTNKKIEIIPNGIDLSKFDHNEAPIKKYCDGKKNILFLGRLDERKGVKFLLKAFYELKKRRDDIRLIIAGTGEKEKSLKSFVKRKNLKDVIFLGFFEDKYKASIIQTADIFCSPALYGESLGIVLLEAMAMKKPIVAASNPGYKTVIKDFGANFLVNPKDTDEFVVKIEMLLNNDKLREKLSNWLFEEVQKYEWKKVAKKIENVYKSALKK